MNNIGQYTGIWAILIYSVILSFILKFSKKKEAGGTEEKEAETVREKTVTPLDPEDEDMVVACLAAAIECRNETHQNVRIVSVREI